MAGDRQASLSGLTSDEAQEFHGIFMSSFIAFTVIAVIAHVLVWFWRPWFTRQAEADPATSMIDSVQVAMNTIMSVVT